MEQHGKGAIALLNLPTSELKRQLATGKDLGTVMKFFFDSFVDHPGFMEAGRPITIPSNLQQAVGKMIGAMWPGQDFATEWQIAEVPLLRIIHGSVKVNSSPGVLLWASDISVGILALPNARTGNTVYGRMTLTNPMKKQ